MELLPIDIFSAIFSKLCNLKDWRSVALASKTTRIKLLQSTLHYFCVHFSYNALVEILLELSRLEDFSESPPTWSLLHADNAKHLSCLHISMESSYLSGMFDLIAQFPELRGLQILGNFDSDITELPTGLQSLVLGDMFNSAITTTFPNTLQHLHTGERFEINKLVLPKTLASLSYEFRKTNIRKGLCDFVLLPTQLKSLKPSDNVYCLNQFKELSLEELDLTIHSAIHWGSIPMNLKSLSLPNIHNFAFHKMFPNRENGESFFPQLEHLAIGDHYNEPVDDLPKTLKSLKLGFHFNRPLNRLPPNLETLELGWYFNRSIEGIPSGIKILKFGGHFDQPLDMLPPGLEYLELGRMFFNTHVCLPKSLKYLKLPRHYGEPGHFRTAWSPQVQFLEPCVEEDYSGKFIWDLRTLEEKKVSDCCTTKCMKA